MKLKVDIGEISQDLEIPKNLQGNVEDLLNHSQNQLSNEINPITGKKYNYLTENRNVNLWKKKPIFIKKSAFEYFTLQYNLALMDANSEDKSNFTLKTFDNEVNLFKKMRDYVSNGGLNYIAEERHYFDSYLRSIEKDVKKGKKLPRKQFLIDDVITGMFSSPY